MVTKNKYLQLWKLFYLKSIIAVGLLQLPNERHNTDLRGARKYTKTNFPEFTRTEKNNADNKPIINE